MSKHGSSYTARQVGNQGYVDYTRVEDETWNTLYRRQMRIIGGRACDEYLHGLEMLDLPADRVAQIPDVSAVLRAATGWELAPVAAVIPFDEFFGLLANRQFPAATFIRRREDIDYLQEPDIFHEIFGHCPLLTNQVYADFVQAYGELGIGASRQQQVYLARLFWFTVEFGLINTDNGLRIYGAGILSSKGETVYALEDSKPVRKPFDVDIALRTPYRIDIYQPIYFVIEHFEELYAVMNTSLLPKIQQAMDSGLLPAMFAPKNKPLRKPAVKDQHLC